MYLSNSGCLKCVSIVRCATLKTNRDKVSNSQFLITSHYLVVTGRRLRLCRPPSNLIIKRTFLPKLVQPTSFATDTTKAGSSTLWVQLQTQPAPLLEHDDDEEVETVPSGLPYLSWHVKAEGSCAFEAMLAPMTGLYSSEKPQLPASRSTGCTQYAPETMLKSKPSPSLVVKSLT